MWCKSESIGLFCLTQKWVSEFPFHTYKVAKLLEKFLKGKYASREILGAYRGVDVD
jgi:hypothetical protein